MNFCKNCGRPINDDEEYCEDCKEDEDEDGLKVNYEIRSRDGYEKKGKEIKRRSG